MKNLFIKFALCFSLPASLYAQNIGIGLDNATRAKLEVVGVAGLGKTTAIFGDSRGVSLHADYPGIGLNQYLDNSQYGRYLANGFAAAWKFIHDDFGLSQGLQLNMYPSGTANFTIPSSNTVWTFSINNRWRIVDPTVGGLNGMISVGRSNGNDGTAMLLGTVRHSHFNYSTGENTYIRGGKSSSRVYLNDIPNGNVVFGNGNATVGINTDYYIPPTTLEIRQSNGGIEMMLNSRTDLPWEWRVAAGSPANFQLYHQNVYKNQFLYTTGALSVASDARLKENIEPLENMLGKLMQLRPVTYFMKTDTEMRSQSIGLIAQEVLPLFPELVAINMGDEGHFGLDYSGFSVVALKGMQEEQLMLNALQAKTNAIEDRLRSLNLKINQHHGKK